jgi:hypothetical protein
MKMMQWWPDFDRIPIVDLSTCTNPSLSSEKWNPHLPLITRMHLDCAGEPRRRRNRQFHG